MSTLCRKHCFRLHTAVLQLSAQEEGHRRARLTPALNVSSSFDGQGLCGSERKGLACCLLVFLDKIENLIEPSFLD